MSHPISEWTKKELKNEVAALRAELANAKAEVETAKRIARENYDACNAYMGISTKVRGDNDKLRQQLGEERQKVVDAAETISAMQIEAATLRHPPAPGASAALREQTGHLIQALSRISFTNALDESALTTIKEVNGFLARLAPTAPANGSQGGGKSPDILRYLKSMLTDSTLTSISRDERADIIYYIEAIQRELAQRDGVIATLQHDRDEQRDQLGRSRRSYENAIETLEQKLTEATAPASGEPGDGELLPKEPPPGLLMSMAIRYDHALGCPGYYDQQQLFGEKGPSHSQRLESTLTTMRQLYEEVSGHGFYRKSRESEYAAITAHQPPTAKREGEP